MIPRYLRISSFYNIYYLVSIPIVIITVPAVIPLLLNMIYIYSLYTDILLKELSDCGFRLTHDIFDTLSMSYKKNTFEDANKQAANNFSFRV